MERELLIFLKVSHKYRLVQDTQIYKLHEKIPAGQMKEIIRVLAGILLFLAIKLLEA